MPLQRRSMVLLRVVLIFAALNLYTTARAEITFHTSIPVSFSLFIPCADGGNGEFVEVSGNLHALITANINKNRVSGQAHFQPQGITGTGETTGARYQANGVTRESFSGSLQNGQLSESFVNNFVIIGQGAGNNFVVQQNIHVTVNATGEVTAQVFGERIYCR